MATPPPYSNITGISRAVMKDNSQETIANYNGNARPGELVVNLVVDPPELYVGNNSGQLTAISSGGGGGGLPITNGTSNINIPVVNGNVTITANGTSTWTFGTDGDLTIPGGSKIADNNTGIQLIAGPGGTVRLASNNDQSWWIFKETGELQLALSNNGNLDGGHVIALGNIILNANNKKLQLDQTGNLSLPDGGSIYSLSSTPSGAPGNTIVLQPAGTGANTNQKLMIYPTAGDGDHIHMTSGNLYETELFLGSDNFFVKLANTGNVVVYSNDGAGNTATWTFGSDGDLTLPGSILSVGNIEAGVIYGSPAPYITGFSTIRAVDKLGVGGNTTNSNISLYKNGNIEATSNVNLVVNTGTPRTWQFATTGNLTLPGNTWGINFANGDQASAPLVDVLNTNGLTTTYYPTFVENRTDGQIVRADVDLSYRTDNNTLTVGNISLGRSATFSVTTYANLPAPSTAGIRAFINDSNLSPVGNFGEIVGNGGGNTVGVWSDGTNWRIG